MRNQIKYPTLFKVGIYILQVNLQFSLAEIRCFLQTIDTREQPMYVQHLKRSLKMVVPEQATEFPGFTVPAGVQPVLLVFREGLLNGRPDVKVSVLLVFVVFCFNRALCPGTKPTSDVGGRTDNVTL